MNYFEMICVKDSRKTAIIEDGIPYTYGSLSDMALQMSEKIKEIRKINNNSKKEVYIIQETTILKQLILFLACNAIGVIPMIVPADAKVMPDIEEVPDSACMAVMTSGTTGVPKILYRTYESWADFFPIQNRIFGIGKDSILFAQGSLAFTGNMNLYMAQFYEGATIVAENKFNPYKWADIIKKENVNAVYLIPTKLLLLPQIIKEKNENIKSVLSGSQSMGKSDAKKLKEIFPKADIILYYGASELNYITYVTDRDMTSKRNLIGKPFPGVDVFIRDGEIFVDNKYHVEGIKCPYSLSDKGYMDEDGNLYFDGRSDDIVSIRGRKISLMRIENEIEKIEYVNEAAVMLIEEDTKSIVTAFVEFNDTEILKESIIKRNGAFRVPEFAGIDSKSDIFARLRKSLAHYEMPMRIISVNKMYHNESGKKDKKNLRKRYMEGNNEF